MGKVWHGMGGTSLKQTVPKPRVSQAGQGVLLLSKQARNTLGSSAGSRGEPHQGFTSEIPVLLLLPWAVESSRQFRDLRLQRRTDSPNNFQARLPSKYSSRSWAICSLGSPMVFCPCQSDDGCAGVSRASEAGSDLPLGRVWGHRPSAAT